MIPFPYNLFGILALVIASALGGATVQRWHSQAQEKQHVEAQAEVDRLAHISNVKRIDVVVAAQNRASDRAIADRAAADSARTELDGVRASADAAVAAARVSQEACIDRAIALNDVFKSCTAEIGGLAEKADRHVSDIRTLSESWPTAQTPE